jgi:hypothetical protein
MTQSLTDLLQQTRLIVVSTDQARKVVRLKAENDACTDLSCHDQTLVMTDDGPTGDLSALNPGDIVRVTTLAGRPQQIVVVRRVWDELSSPEF